MSSGDDGSTHRANMKYGAQELELKHFNRSLTNEEKGEYKSVVAASQNKATGRR